MSGSILDNLPSVIKKQVGQEDVKAVNDNVDKPFLLVCSRDLEKNEIDVLNSYGKTLVWRESFVNIPLSQHEFAYCVCDVRNKVHRQMLMKENLDAYHVVCVVGWLDAHDDFVDDLNAENVVRTFPDHQAFKQDFDRLLLSAKIKKPNMAKSFLRCFLKLVNGWQNE